MFKKAIKIGAQNQLSGKDKKSIKNKMSQTFDEEAVECLFAKNEKIVSAKVTGSKMLIYNGQQYPILVDGTGKQDYFPTVYACQAFEPIIKYIILNDGVQNFIFNGANLMWPGVFSFKGLGKFKKDDVIGIKSAKGQVIAIGALGCSLEQLQSSDDKSGIAAYILHYKNDKLYELGPKVQVQCLMKAENTKETSKQQAKIEQKVQKGQQKIQSKKQQKNEKKQEKKEEKKPKKKQKSPQKQPSQQQDESDDQADFMGLVHNRAPKQPVIQVQSKKKVTFQQFEEDKGGKKKGKKAKGKVSNKHDDVMEEQMIEKPAKIKKSKIKNQQSEEEEQMVQKQPANKKKGKNNKPQQKVERKKSEEESEKGSEKGSDDQESQVTKKEQVSTISTKIMDDYLKQCFLNVLKLSKVQAELPIDSGRFYMDYMLLARPEGVKLEIKQSSYKKLGKFYEEMAKKKFIEFKHGKDKKGQQGSKITAIFYDSQELKNFVPTIKKMAQKDVQVKQDFTNMKAAKLRISKTLVVQNVYKCSEQLYNHLFQKKVDFLKDIDEEQPKIVQKKTQYFTQDQLKVKMHKYIQHICQNKTENKKDKKAEKMAVIDYKKNQYIAMLLQKQITEYEENLAEQEANKPPQNSDEQQNAKKNKKDKKKGNIFRIDREFLVNKMMKKTTAFHHILDKEHNFESFRQGEFKGVQIFAEKANNKNITRVVGLETFIIPKEEIDRQIHSLSQMFQQKFASSVNVLNLPGKNAGKQLILHGTFIDPLQEFFLQQGVAKNHITLVNKIDKKKKK